MSEEHGPNPPEQRDGPSWKVYVADLLGSVSAVIIVGGLLFAISGVWPPLVAIESSSMTPNIEAGDLVFVMEEDRFPGDAEHGDTGVVTAQAGQDEEYAKFHRTGDVIVYAPDGVEARTPIIHRAMFWVEDGQNWYDQADQEYVGSARDCEQLANCPAPHAGFVTKGDYNSQYDQAGSISDVVKPGWVIGTAQVRVPWLGCIRLSTTGESPEQDRVRRGPCELF